MALQPPLPQQIPTVTIAEHERLLRAAVGPLEQTIKHLKEHLEAATKDKQALMSELTRLSGLLDAMQSEATDNVRQLPMLGSGTGAHLAGSDSPDVVQTVIHRLVSMGVFTPHGEEGRRGTRR